MTETRSAAVLEVRGENEGTVPGFTARVTNYEVPDSHRTSWNPGVFRESLERGLPVLVWGHDPNDPIGRAVAYREVERRSADEPAGLDVDFEFDDLDAVPRAKQAYAQVKSGTAREFSFAFERIEDQADPNHRGVTRITRANVHEFSIVMKGSVPGTKVLSVRSEAGETVPETSALELLERMRTGEIDLTRALAELDALRAPAAMFEVRALVDVPEGSLDRARALVAGLETELLSKPAAEETLTAEPAAEEETREEALTAELEPDEEITEALSVLGRLSR
jgi:HK97 family phage prohead protease